MLKSGIIRDIEVAIKLVDAILEKSKDIKSVVFCGKDCYGKDYNEVFYREYPWFYVEFPKKCRIKVYDGSVFVQEV